VPNFLVKKDNMQNEVVFLSKNCLLSVDWDYFIITAKENWGSFAENQKNIINMWYKRYLQNRARGKDIRKMFRLSRETENFWNNIKAYFQFTNNTSAYVSDSHALSYEIAKENNCNIVYSFDSHSDLGYGGLSSLEFEVNCANWLGKLLKDKIIHQANIIYSPFTTEKPKFFKQLNKKFNVRYIDFSQLEKVIKVKAIHICRSGAWTPPWFDEKFKQFVNALGIKFKVFDCPLRKWDTNLSYSERLYYLMA
jgi:hypothetical protein